MDGETEASAVAYTRYEWDCPDCGYHGHMDYREVPLYNDKYGIIGHADGEWHDKHGMALVEIYYNAASQQPSKPRSAGFYLMLRYLCDMQ